MWLSEFFTSVQGEGQYSGVESVFVRTSGCNLRCSFCDTPYTSWKPEGTHKPWEAIVDRVLETEIEHVVLTGGEPLLQSEVVPFTQRLANAGRLVTIETAGTFDREVSAHLMSISPKLANSTPHDARWSRTHDARRINKPVLERFLRDYRCQLKFVVCTESDLREIEQLIDSLPGATPEHVWLMPEGRSVDVLNMRMEWITPAAKDRGWHACTRLQIELFGDVRGT